MCTRVQDFVQVAMGSFLEVCSGFCCNKLFKEFFLVVFFFPEPSFFFPWHCITICMNTVLSYVYALWDGLMKY